MKEKIKNVSFYIKNRPKRFILLALFLVIIFFSLGKNGNDSIRDISVVRGDLVQEVAVIGKTKAFQSVDLAFETSGKVSYAPAVLGEKVSRGSVLAQLETSTKLAEVARAKANLFEEEVRLAEISRQSMDGSNQARESMVATIRNSYTRVDDAVRNYADRFFKDPATQSTYFELIIVDGATTYHFLVNDSLKRELNILRRGLEKDIQDWQADLNSLSINSDLGPFVLETEKVLNDTKIFLDKLASAINSISNVDFQYQSNLSGYKADVSTARTSVSTAISNLIIAKEKLSASPQDISGVGGPSSLDAILAQEARVAQYRAQLQSAEADLSRLTIYSPIDGTVTRQDAKLGEIVTAGKPVVSVISVDELEIEANVSEVNIGKVNVGNSVKIIFDAFPGQEFSGEVIFIDPAETMVDGVVNYKIKVAFTDDSSLIKSGLTSSIYIKTLESQGVLKIPLYAVRERDGQSFVSKVVNGQVVETPINVGFVGNDSFVEIISGLSEGEVVRVGE